MYYSVISMRQMQTGVCLEEARLLQPPIHITHTLDLYLCNGAESVAQHERYMLISCLFLMHAVKVLAGPHNVFLPRFNFFFGKIGCGPFRWAGNHCVVPRVSCWANKRLPQRLRRAPGHAKGFKTNTVTRLEVLSSQHSSLMICF